MKDVNSIINGTLFTLSQWALKLSSWWPRLYETNDWSRTDGSRNSSVGRALDWRSKGPWFNPGFRHWNFRRLPKYFLPIFHILCTLQITVLTFNRNIKYPKELSRLNLFFSRGWVISSVNTLIPYFMIKIRELSFKTPFKFAYKLIHLKKKKIEHSEV